MESTEISVDHNQDTSQERYSGYGNQVAYQRDLKKYFDGKICGALTRDKKFCKDHPMENGRCQRHGGKSPNGLDHPRTTHGQYSRYIPKELMRKYKEAHENEELLSLRDETALVTTRIMELVENVDHKAGKAHITTMMQNYRRWQNAKKKGIEGADMIRIDFEESLEEIEKDTKTWDDIGNMVNLKRRLVDSEMKKMNNMSQYIPVDKVMLLIGALMDIVVKEVEKREGVYMRQEDVEDLNTDIARKFRKVTNQSEEV